MAAATVTTQIAPVSVPPPAIVGMAAHGADAPTPTEIATTPDSSRSRLMQEVTTTAIATTYLISSTDVARLDGDECPINVRCSASANLSMPTPALSAISQLAFDTNGCRSTLPLIKKSHSPSVAFSASSSCDDGEEAGEVMKANGPLTTIQLVDNGTQTDALSEEGPQFVEHIELEANVELEDENLLQTALAVSIDRQQGNNLLETRETNDETEGDENNIFNRDLNVLDTNRMCNTEFSRYVEDEIPTKSNSLAECDNYLRQTQTVLENDACEMENAINCGSANGPSLEAADVHGLERSVDQKAPCNREASELMNDFVADECTCNAATHFNCGCDDTTANCTYQERIIDYDNFRIIEHVIDCSHEGFCKQSSKMHCTGSWKDSDAGNCDGSKEQDFACQELVAFIGESYQIIDNAQSSIVQAHKQTESTIATPVLPPDRFVMDIDEEKIFCAENLDVGPLASAPSAANQLSHSIVDIVDDNNNKGLAKASQILCTSRNSCPSEASKSISTIFATSSAVSSPIVSHTHIDERGQKQEQPRANAQLPVPSVALALKALKSKLTPLAPSFHPTRKKQTAASSPTGFTTSMFAHEQTSIYYQQQPQPTKKQQHFLQQTTTTTMLHTMSLHPHSQTQAQAQQEPQQQPQVLPILQQSFSKNSFQRHQQQQLSLPVPQNLPVVQNFVTSPTEHQPHCTQNLNSLGGLPHIHLHNVAATSLPSNALSVAVGNAPQPPHLYPVQVISVTTAATTPGTPNSEQESNNASTVVAAVSNGTAPWPLLEAAPIFINTNGELRSFCPTHGPPALNTAGVGATMPNGVAFNQSPVVNLAHGNSSQHPHSHSYKQTQQHQTQAQPPSRLLSTAPAACSTSIITTTIPTGSLNATNRLMMQQQQIKGINQNPNPNHRHHHPQLIQHQHHQSHHQHQQQQTQPQQLESVSALQLSGKGKLYRGE